MAAKMDHNKLETPKKLWRFEPSLRFSERKRALFPSQDSDSDSDLGHISPLENSSSPDRYKNLLNVSKPDNIDFRYFTCFDNSRKNDENCDPSKISPIKQKNNNLDNEILAPNTPTQNNSSEFKNGTFVPETPLKSPTEILKTPHDTSSSNLHVPKLIKKSLLDISNIDKSNLKRNSDSPDKNTANKSFKLDHSVTKPPKARTALFTDSQNIISVKSFYPKTESNKHDVSFRLESFLKSKNISRKPTQVYLCNRGKGKNKKKYFGQINAGVRHGIKKPKRKPSLTKTQLLKAALNIVKNSPLNDVLDEIFDENISNENECGVSLEQIQKMDSILKNLDIRSNAQPLSVFSENHEKSPTVSKKRSLSPQPESANKFFKSKPSRATVTISNNIKFDLNNGELNLIEKQNRISRPKQNTIDFNTSDFSFEEKPIEDQSLSDILKSLEDDKIVEPEKKNISNDMLLSPTSLVCDMTSGLALDSPKSQDLPEVDQKASFKKCISFLEMNTSGNKLFPIFYGKQNSVPKHEKKESHHVKNIRKIWKPLTEHQTLIDAGQKKFGVTQCPECKVVYSVGEPEDEIMHFQFHNSVNVFRYNGWKHERIVKHLPNGKVIQINPNDSKIWWKKVRELTEIIDRELGFVDVQFVHENKKVFLCIINKQIVGCLISEPKLQAHKMLSSEGIDECSEEVFPVKCGVLRIWVAAPHRKKGIATCLMNSMRSHFMYGHILSVNEIAFSAPTDLGKKFAEKYTKTANFFVYTS